MTTRVTRLMRSHLCRLFKSWFVAVGVAGIALASCAADPTPTQEQTRPPTIASSPTGSPSTIPSVIETSTDAPPTLTVPNPGFPSPTVATTPTAIAPVEANALGLIQAFAEAPYRVVSVAKSPFAPYMLIVAAERSAAECGSPEAPQRCTNDETCGSLYTSPVCFFFVEPSFDATADPATRFVARWPDEPTLSSLITDSFRFIDGRTVEFRAQGGDAGYTVQELWWLDLVTGALALQSRVEQGGGVP